MNPFVYDSEVSGGSFCGRTESIEYLTRSIYNASNIVLYSRRRMGKSSLVKEVLAYHIDKSIVIFTIDIYSVSNIRDLYHRISEGIKEALLESVNTFDSASALLKEVQNYFIDSKVTLEFDGVRPKFKIESVERDYYRAMEKLLNGFFLYTKKKERKVVFSIDEFQKLASFDERNKIEEILRTIFKNQNHTCFIFTGSKQHMLKEMFTEHDRPFYKLGDIYDLPSIEQDVYYTWASKHLMRQGIIIDKAAFEYLYYEAEMESRFIQLVLHKIYNMGPDRKYSLSEMDELISMAASTMDYYAIKLDEDYTLKQQNALKLLAACGGENIFEQYLLDEYFLDASSLQTAIKSLLKKENVIAKEGKRILFLDVEFKLWLRNTST